jgi:regulatory protein
MIITAINKQKYRQRVNVYVDGRFAFALGLTVAQEAGLYTGMAVSDADLHKLQDADVRQSAYDAALRLLAYRPRSEKELRLRLARRGYAPPLVDETLARLRRLGYVDDEAFARFWTESRDSSSPRSRRLLRSELLQKGVKADTASEAVVDLSDEEAAYRAAAKRLRTVQDVDYPAFRRRLGDFLLRRGFSYDVIRRTVDRCWVEKGGSPADGSEA